MSKKVVLLQGGLGAERDVSLATGRAFAQALDELNYDYVIVEADANLPSALEKAKPDVALLALHGKYAEDGIVQGICEYLKIPYSGSGVLASSLCMDKVFSKAVLQQQGVLVASQQVLDMRYQSLDDFKLELEAPVVVKPSREGSSVGITICKTSEDVLPAIKEAAKYDYHVMIETFIPGFEVTVPILAGKALTPIEIRPKEGFYDYKNKYTKGNTEYLLPPSLPEPWIAHCQEVALKVSQICRLKTYGRIDFRVDPNGKPYVLEINTLPGCTETSLVPQSAKHDGIPFSEFVKILVDSASLDYQGVQ
ncbi:MAG: D-alanine--D-alanine ligase [Bdellovibrionaceae bacterium]|nr:D-alanine--D-alanine ligase [Pseudobdellovibrionaceae bacterium]